MFCTLQHATDQNWLEVVFCLWYTSQESCASIKIDVIFHSIERSSWSLIKTHTFLCFTSPKCNTWWIKSKIIFKNSFTMFLSFWYLHTEEDFSQLTLKLARRNSNQRIKKIYRRSWIKLDSLIISISCFGFQK